MKDANVWCSKNFDQGDLISEFLGTIAVSQGLLKLSFIAAGNMVSLLNQRIAKLHQKRGLIDLYAPIGAIARSLFAISPVPTSPVHE